MADPSTEESLLGIAAEVLQAHGFAIRNEKRGGTPYSWVLAESDLFVIAVTAAHDFADLREAESVAVAELLERVESSQAGAKRWDSYLVLMTSMDATEPAEAKALVDIEYDTRGVRRLVEVAVEPTRDELRRVLRPFMPLPPPADEGLTSAYEDLEAQLVLNGVTGDFARRVVSVWRDKGHLDDV